MTLNLAGDEHVVAVQRPQSQIVTERCSALPGTQRICRRFSVRLASSSDLEAEAAVGYGHGESLVDVIFLGLSVRHSHYRSLIAQSGDVPVPAAARPLGAPRGPTVHVEIGGLAAALEQTMMTGIDVANCSHRPIIHGTPRLHSMQFASP
jgi:hypothetical protein